jgi:hypothetical protein
LFPHLSSPSYSCFLISPLLLILVSSPSPRLQFFFLSWSPLFPHIPLLISSPHLLLSFLSILFSFLSSSNPLPHLLSFPHLLLLQLAVSCFVLTASQTGVGNLQVFVGSKAGVPEDRIKPHSALTLSLTPAELHIYNTIITHKGGYL